MKSMKTEEKKNRKGIIRTAFVAPFLIFIIIVTLAVTLLMDLAIKNTLEFIAEKIHGAEVNIASVDTSLSELRMTIKKIEVTDKDLPEFNQFEIGEINLALLWDAILRAKFVVNNADVSAVRVMTKRSYPGAVYPSTPGESQVDKTLDNAKEEFSGNVFGDIASLLGGESLKDIGKIIGGELKSEKRFQEIDSELKAKEKEIKDRFKDLPKDKEIKNFEKRLAAIKWNDLGNLLKAPKVLKEVDDLKKDIDEAKKSYEKANESLKSGFKSIETSYKEAEKFIQNDIDDLNKRAKLPSLDTESIANVLFGKDIISKVEQYKGYFNTAKDYIPKKKNKVAAPVKRARGKGRDYQYGIQNGYPLFWIKKASLSSETKQGNVAGQILNITTNQRQIDKPTTLEIKADFPPKNIRNIQANATIDMREVATLTSNVSIGAHPVIKQKLSDSKDVQFIIESANNNSLITTSMTEERLALDVKNTLTQIEYKTAAKSKQVSEVLEKVANRTPKLTLDAKVSGKWSALGFEIKSNLAEAIKNAVQVLVQEKINKAKQQIKEQVEAQVAETRSKIDSQINSLKSKYEQELAKGKNELDKFKDKVEKEKKSASKKAEGKANDLLKNFKL